MSCPLTTATATARPVATATTAATIACNKGKMGIITIRTMLAHNIWFAYQLSVGEAPITHHQSGSHHHHRHHNLQKQ
jgi:hypothetical protein